ncbi:hypothetical protein HBI65_042110 [Parastagonospora nodorum]|nr:hypothetical protein HBI78_225700 [Parastagonospora nodorum]KAH5047462.1 hypothetical protein HBH96_227590 [Parastagonospora nodorum]KAH5211342.1 hypothetical protein HBH77_071620 [Parastagonospora nodorum]KAH6104240.1 hypothetical protein HBI65_042110 [Parastagonospora nodorum]
MSFGNKEAGDFAGDGCNLTHMLVAHLLTRSGAHDGVDLVTSASSATTTSSNMSRSRAFSLSTATSTDSLPHAPPSRQLGTVDNESSKKKRKLQDGGAVEAHESNTVAAENEASEHDAPSDERGWEAAHRRVEAKLLKAEEKRLEEQARRLDWQNKANEKDVTAHQIKVKHMNTTTHLKAEATRMHEVTVQKEGIIVDLQYKITQRDLTINQLGKDKLIMRLENSELKAQNKYLVEHASAPMPCRDASCVPHFDPSVHSHERYQHPNAPKKNALYKYFQPTRTYRRGTGKVRPGRYGSGLNWDLGLCLVTFTSKAVCSDTSCEYRHGHLDPDERLYMGFLTPNGPSFIASTDEYMRGKASKPT